MVRIKHKTKFKRSLRDAQPPQLNNPYAPPQVVPHDFQKAEDACKLLAASDVAIRDQAMQDLHGFLKRLERDTSIDRPLEFAKLWKGLFYCMWHSDKPLVQLDCAERVADLTLSLSTPEARADWCKQSWLRMDQEWGGIDKWRVDKFYSLMRRMLNRQLQAFRDAMEQDAQRALEMFVLPLQALYDSRLTGVASHITDILIEEAVATALPMESFHLIFSSLVLMVLRHGSKDHCEHIYDRVWKKLIGGYQEDDETIEWLAEVPWDTIMEELQEAALAEGTKDRNRAFLGNMIDDLEGFLGQVDEVEELVEIDSEEEGEEARLEARRHMELRRRQTAGSEVMRSKQQQQKRSVQRKLKKVKEAGDDKGAARLLQEARHKGIDLPKKKKKKKGKLAGLASLDDKSLAKKQRVRHKKRRV